MITVEQFLRWKVLPRFMMLASTVMSWRCAEWFMSLDDPTASQSAFAGGVLLLFFTFMLMEVFGLSRMMGVE